MSSDNEKKPGAAGTAIAIIIVIVIALSVFFFSPGMMIMAIMQYLLNTNLDKGQMWTFAILICLLIYGGLWVTQGKDFRQASKIYLYICICVTASSLIIHYGFKANFIVGFLNYYFN